VRIFDLILAVLVLLVLVAIARREFPAYEGRAMSRPAAVASPVPSPVPE
jgi:hypothetical protein